MLKTIWAWIGTLIFIITLSLVSFKKIKSEVEETFENKKAKEKLDDVQETKRRDDSPLDPERTARLRDKFTSK